MIDDETDDLGNTGSKDKIHPPKLGETQDFDGLSSNEEENSYELDVKGRNKDYDHPLPYDTSAPNGEDDNSDYDEANPYVGNEYDTKEAEAEEGLNDLGMHVDNGESVSLSPEDEYLAKTPEDDRDDLDEEGYPVNNDPTSP